MRKWKLMALLWSIAPALLMPACRSLPQHVDRSQSPVPPELLARPYLFEITRHLYRWYLDEAEVNQVMKSKKFIFQVRIVPAKLDEGDKSVLAEIVLPQLGIKARVKKTDYTIEEFHTRAKSDVFKITQVNRKAVASDLPAGSSRVEVDTQEMIDYLFRTRNQRDYPDSELLTRLRKTVRQELAKEGLLAPNSTQVVFLAPLSPVANECWVFWESGRKLLHFVSDIDLANPAVWEHESLLVRFFGIDQQVVVSHEEAPGSNRFLTRAEVGRALYNCIVLGQKQEIQPPSEKP